MYLNNGKHVDTPAIAAAECKGRQGNCKITVRKQNGGSGSPIRRWLFQQSSWGVFQGIYLVTTPADDAMLIPCKRLLVSVA